MPRTYAPLRLATKQKLSASADAKLRTVAFLIKGVIAIGHRNCADIATRLNTSKVRRRRGNIPWTAEQVSRIIRDVRKRTGEDLLPYKGRTKLLSPAQCASMSRAIKLAVAASQLKARNNALRLGRIISDEKRLRTFFNNSQIAELLNFRGETTARGKPWSGSRVERVARVYNKMTKG